MLPVVCPDGVPRYNNSQWDPIFEFAGLARIPIVLHTGTGLADVVFERGPGGAVFNYTRQINDAMDAVCLLVAGGVLDRHPGAHVACIEAGASWLAALGERMDEVYAAHQFYVKPKLSLKPSEIVRRQVHCSFQFDRACVATRRSTGHEALLWASDYPHMEGTFPHSLQVIERLFSGLEISDHEKADILGGTAARLFQLRQSAPASGGGRT
jgi:predicted TIM-barrel fold metal-dependent hydrolase